jgi:hypothetical protein
MTNPVDLSLVPRECLTLFCSYITKPSDIVRMRGTSVLFHNVVAVEAARAFFQNRQRSIAEWGFLPTSDDHYQNFKTLFLFIKHRYRQVEFEEAVRIADFSAIDKPNPVSLGRIDETFVRAQSFYEVYSLKLAGVLFPILARQNRTFRVMAEPRDGEGTTNLHLRLWKWLRNEKDKITQLTEAVHRNPDEPVPRHHYVKVIPYQITFLTHLRKLDLSGHQLTFVPSFLTQLQHLERLTLQRNQIANISCRFDQMPALRRIDLRGNYLAQLPLPAFFNKEAVVLFCVDARSFSCDSDNLSDYPSVLFVADPMSLVRGSTGLLERVVHHNMAVVKRAVEKGLDDSSPLKPFESQCIELAESTDYQKSWERMISLQMRLNSDVD